MPATTASWLDQALILAMLGLGVWLAAACAVALAFSVLEPVLARTRVRQRKRLLIALAALPLGLGLANLLLALAPTGGGWIARHCHPGLGCAAHAPLAGDGGPTLWLAMGATGLIAILFTARVLALIARQRTLHRRLAALGFGAGSQGVHIIEHAAPLAFTAGWWRPRVCLTRSLLDRVTPAQRDTIISHERGHARSRDNLVIAMAGLLFCPVSQRPARRLLTGLRAAAEQLADQCAVDQVGDATAVAETLIQARRLCHGHPGHLGSHAPAGTSALIETDLESRVHALLAPAGAEVSRLVLVTGVAIGLALSAAGAGASHHVAEGLFATPADRTTDQHATGW